MSDIRNLIFAPGTQGPPGPGTSGSGGISSGANVSLAGLPIFNAGQSTSSVLKFNTLLPGSNFTIVNNNDGTLTLSAVVNLDQGQGVVPVGNLPVATATSFGVVKPDNTTISINSGIISAIFTPPVTSVFGRTGDIVSENSDYNFSQIDGIVAPSQLPIGTDAAFGAFKVDNTTITATAGVLAVVPQGSTLPTLSAFTFLGNATDSPAVAVETALLRLGDLDEVLVLQNLGAQDFSVSLPVANGTESIAGFKSPAGKNLSMNFYTDVGTTYPYNDYTQYGGYFQIQVQSLSSGKQTVLTNWTGDLSLSAYDSVNSVPANLFLNTTNVKVNAASQFVLTPVGTLPVTLEDGAIETSGEFLYITIDGVRYIIGSKGQRFDAAYSAQTVSDAFGLSMGSSVSKLILKASGDLSTGGVTLPEALFDGQEFTIACNKAIAALTLGVSVGYIDASGTTSVVLNLEKRSEVKLTWVLADSTWYFVDAFEIPAPPETTFHNYGDQSGSITIDDTYDIVKISATDTLEIVMDTSGGGSSVKQVTIMLISNSKTITWTHASFPNATDPTLTTTDGNIDTLVFYKVPGEGNWIGGLSLPNVVHTADA